MALIQSNDLEALYNESHTIKGAAANIGASELSAAADSLEKAARQGRSEALSSLADNLLAYINHTNSAIDLLLRTGPPEQAPHDEQTPAKMDYKTIKALLNELPELFETDWGLAQNHVDYLNTVLTINSDASRLLQDLYQAMENFDIDISQEISHNILKTLDIETRS